MKFGIRECCDVVLKAKANQKIGNKVFYKGEPVCYFDTLKTSSLEGSATTTYATGGRGNARLMAWEGERTLTFTMEDALISPESFMILSGAGLIEGKSGTEDNPADPKSMIQVHNMETTDDIYIDATSTEKAVYVKVKQSLSKHPNATIYAMIKDGDDIITEPYIGTVYTQTGTDDFEDNEGNVFATADEIADRKVFVIKNVNNLEEIYGGTTYKATDLSTDFMVNEKVNNVETLKAKTNITVMADYYTDKGTGNYQIEITPDKFGGTYYLEASTLFRTREGVDMPAEFIIPNCKIQSNFSFSMSSSGDPSTFTFTMDAFPDYTRFDGTKKVLAAIQVINEAQEADDMYRSETKHASSHEDNFN